jgi:transglutaminase-like putative cysteine protease
VGDIKRKSGCGRNTPTSSVMVDSIITKIKNDYKRESEPLLNVSEIPEAYNLIVNDESLQNPLIINSALVQIIQKHVKPYNGVEDKSRAIFDWMQQNIEYGTSKRRNGYKNSEETLNDKQGICGEMAFLYISMARCCSIKSAYASVTIDSAGKKVYHGCAAVNLMPGIILVDPAYHTFDIKHKSYQIITDKEVLSRFNEWRGQ